MILTVIDGPPALDGPSVQLAEQLLPIIKFFTLYEMVLHQQIRNRS